MVKISVILVAGGSGSRMGAAVPKQFLPLHGVPVLAITLRRFVELLPDSEIVVVLPHAEHHRWNLIARQYGLIGTHKVCSGGPTRFHSVKNGLNTLSPCDYVAVHDAVRPFFSQQLLDDALRTACQYGNAVPAVTPVDSYRAEDSHGNNHIVDRNTLRIIQTPQIFRYDILTDAYKTDFMESFTDDASVVEAAGYRIALCRGDRNNIKITSPEDMILAEAICNSLNS